MKYLISFHSAVDLISFVPFYVSLAYSQAENVEYVQFLKMIRVVRLLRINPQGEMIARLLQRTLKRSREAIFILLFYLCVLAVVGAAIIYTLERGNYTINSDYPEGAYLRPNGIGGVEISPFTSAPACIYFVIVTVTTTGYGDLAPTTMGGRAFASFLCILGVLVLALPISVIGSTFSIEYEKHVQRLKEQAELQARRRRERQDMLDNLRTKTERGIFLGVTNKIMRTISPARLPLTNREQASTKSETFVLDNRSSSAHSRDSLGSDPGSSSPSLRNLRKPDDHEEYNRSLKLNPRFEAEEISGDSSNMNAECSQEVTWLRRAMTASQITVNPSQAP